jgi:hypothetical protein
VGAPDARAISEMREREAPLRREFPQATRQDCPQGRPLHAPSVTVAELRGFPYQGIVTTLHGGERARGTPHLVPWRGRHALRKRAWAAGAGLALLGSPALAADPSAADKETGRNLYVEGMRLLDAHDYAGAERACRGAHSIVQVPPASVCWGRALEGLGRLVEARDAFMEAAHFAASAGEPKVFTEARDAASAEADKLAARIPTLAIAVTGAADTARLSATIDGATIASDTVRLARKVDPGTHVVIVSAPGFRPARIEVATTEGQEARVDVALSPGEAGTEGAKPSAPMAPAPGVSRGVPMLAIVAGGVGVAGLALGVGTALAATSKHSALQGECTGSICPPSAQGDLNSFHSLRTISAASYVVGALGIVGGGALWLLAPSRPSDASARLWVGPASAGVMGAF